MQSLRKITVMCLLTFGVTLAGAAPAMASGVLVPSSESLDFGQAEVHFGSQPQQGVSLFNGSNAATNVKAVEISGPDAAEFAILQNDCSFVEADSACFLEVRFQPQSPGLKSATLEVFESTGTEQIALSGSAVTGTLSAISPSYPTTVVAGESQTQQVTINNSNAGTHIDDVELTGPDASSFSIDYGDCAQATLSANNSCDVGVRFSPSSPGPKSAGLRVTGDASNAPLTIPLSGTGAAGPRVTITPRQALLGEVQLGRSVSQTFTITNTGDFPLGVQEAFMVSGTPLMFPILADQCSGHSVQPGASCTLTVSFEPTTVGTKDASIILITNSNAGVTALGLEGTGVTGQAGLPPAATQPPLPAGALVTSAAHPRLIRLSGSALVSFVNTGLGAICPTGVKLCRVRTILMTRLRAHRTRASHGAAIETPVLLGSSVASLGGGHSAVVRGRLSHSGLALLARRHKLKVSVMVAIAVPGVPTVIQWRTLTLIGRFTAVAHG